ncbi:SpoIIE family protein phosphatase [Actinosynnema pretiosum]|uniref:SpoIIE family protein phosphatase n=1 Tax=Actinosynnema pretiosum TaxID=42197 RepID=UPI001E392DAE|nr:SpoIIE family protein phosphatase [Actinosynnema pretiosum]
MFDLRADRASSPVLVAHLGVDRTLLSLAPEGRTLLGLSAGEDLGALPESLREAVDGAAEEGSWTGVGELAGVPVRVVCVALGEGYALVATPLAAGAGAGGDTPAVDVRIHTTPDTNFAPSEARGEVPGEHLRGLVDALSVVVWAADATTGRYTFVSRHAERLLGYPVERWLGEPGFWESVVHPDDRAAIADRDVEGLSDYELDYRAVAADGRVVWLRDLVRVARDERGEPTALHGVLVDTSPGRAAEERRRFLAGLEAQLQRLEDAGEVMTAATRLLGEHLAADRCAYAEAESDQDHFTMSGDHATGLPPLTGRFAMSSFGRDALRAMRAGEPWVVHDSEDDPRLTAEDRLVYRRTGIRAVICLPLLRGGRFAAAMAAHQATPRRWAPAEVELVSVVVNRCWESVQRTHADRALRESERRFRQLVERATDGIWVLDRDLRFVEVNPAACALLGHAREDLLGKPVAALLGSERGERLAALLGDEGAPDVVTEVWQVRRADGGAVALELSIQATPTGLQAIGRDITERQRAEAEREALRHREHEIAEALQRSLLPRELPALPRLAAAARYLPASAHTQIGGDWYEVLPVGETTVALSVGDVVGKGPQAAAVMGQLRSALAGYLLDGHSPAAALERLDAFALRTRGAPGSTCACLTLDWSTGELRWASAGHPPPLLVEPERSRFLPIGTGTVLGVPGRATYRDSQVVLPAGGTVVLYTDGLVERRGALIDAGLDALLRLVRDEHELGPDELADRITSALLDGGQDDDVALVVVRKIPEPLRRRVAAEAPELSGMRRRVAEWAGRAGLSDDLLCDLQLALGEAAANAVDHAYPDGPGEFEYRVERIGDGGVRVRVCDWGRWRPEPEDKGHRGRGVQLIQTVGRDAVFTRGPEGTVVEFVVPEGDGPGVPAPRRRVRGPVVGVRCTAGEEFRDAVQVLHLGGDLDLDGVRALREFLLGRVDVADRRPVELDLTGLGYLSSSGVALLLEAAEVAAGRGRGVGVVVTEGSAPARIMAVSGLHGGAAGDRLSLRVVGR